MLGLEVCGGSMVSRARGEPPFFSELCILGRRLDYLFVSSRTTLPEGAEPGGNGV